MLSSNVLRWLIGIMSMAVCGLESNATSQSFIRLERSISLALSTLAAIGHTSLVHCARILSRKSITDIELRGAFFFIHSSEIDLSLWCVNHEILCQRIHSCFFFISISFKVEVTLFALAVI